MRTVSSVSELRAALGPARRHGSTVGLVPTMGALHAGHASLIAQARDESDVVVVSVFVNPTQFNEAADLDAYPRDLAGDIQAAEAAGADLVFAPGAADVYPPGHATTVTVGGDLQRAREEVGDPGVLRHQRLGAALHRRLHPGRPGDQLADHHRA